MFRRMKGPFRSHLIPRTRDGWIAFFFSWGSSPWWSRLSSIRWRTGSSPGFSVSPSLYLPPRSLFGTHRCSPLGSMEKTVMAGGEGDVETWVVATTLIFVYLLVTIVLGAVANKRLTVDLEDFLLYGRKAGFVVLYLTVVATYHSAFAFLGSGGYFYTHGIGFWAAGTWTVLVAESPTFWGAGSGLWEKLSAISPQLTCWLISTRAKVFGPRRHHLRAFHHPLHPGPGPGIGVHPLGGLR